MVDRRPGYPAGACWSIDDIPYHALEHERVKHGGALKRYIETAWPDFGWDDAYRNFLAEFLRFCSVDQLAATRALEMAARCVVETGTAAFYRALAEMSPEPVLRAIAADEARHYKYFYRFFLRYREREQPSRAEPRWRARFGRESARSTPRTRSTPSSTSTSHVYLAWNPRAEFREDDYAAFRAQLRPLAARHFPHRMAGKMLLKPLGLSAPVGRLVVPAVASASRLLFLT